MNLEYRQLLPADFAPDSRVWMYQSNRRFGIGEALQIEDLLNDFSRTWKSHGTPVKGYGNMFFGQFIILMADESATGVSGCSTDSSVRLVKEIEQLFKVSLFDRQLLAFVVKDNIQLLPLSQIQYGIDHQYLDADTLYFNNTIQTKAELEHDWIVPVKDSWLAKRFSFPVAG